VTRGRARGGGTIRVALLAAALATLGQGACARRTAPPAEAPRVDRAALLDPTDSSWRARAPEEYVARVETSRGTFDITVTRAWAPIGADRFWNLVRHGFYDDQRINRVRSGFIAQFGLSGDPAVTAAWAGHTIPDDGVRASNVRGAVAYATTGPDTRLTQVYINLVDNVRLDAQGFAPFGRVTRGMDVVDRLYSGYGESAGGGMRGGKQGGIEREGNAWLDARYPKLDRIVRATIVETAR
jgi:homoserine O-acetyltransferase